MDEQPGLVARAALRLTAWTERWIPDAFIFALLATVLVFVAALVWTPSSPLQVVDAWGNGFWDLIPFTLQMSLIIITGHVLATSAPMGKAIRAIAGWATHAARRRGAGHVLRAGHVVVQLGLQPDLQRGAGEGGGAARRRRRLSRARGGEPARASAASGRRASADRRRCRWRRPARCSRRSATSSPPAAWCRAASSRSATRSSSGRASCRCSSRSSSWCS